WAFPNYMPFHLPPGEPAHRGARLVNMPYLLRTADDTQVRLRIKPDSPFTIVPHENPLGYAIFEDGRYVTATTFEPRLPWADQLTADGTPMRATGLSQHGDMLVLNAAPGCEYFVVPTESGKSQNLSCTFCLYGLPDKRMVPLGQELFKRELPESTLQRVAEACSRPDTHARHLYLVGGSMLDMAAEGDRFVQMARFLAERGLTDRYYVTCGSGALPRAQMEALKDAGVRGACFNLEVWDPVQFARVCPGKDKIVGRDRWIASLEEAADIFGAQDVMSAFVGGVELDGLGAMSDPEQALDSAIEAGEYLIPRGIQTVYSLHWKVTGKHRGEEPVYSLDFFLRLNEALYGLRQKHQRPINEEHFCRRCAYMQLEPDYDHAPEPTLWPRHEHTA
ncbi:MAG: hypothetical protein KC613_07585, partial [Myxococcales bacterium]|nr:hypothetical protein [Myxococcales bacterium]